MLAYLIQKEGKYQLSMGYKAYWDRCKWESTSWKYSFQNQKSWRSSIIWPVPSYMIWSTRGMSKCTLNFPWMLLHLCFESRMALSMIWGFICQQKDLFFLWLLMFDKRLGRKRRPMPWMSSPSKHDSKEMEMWETNG
jgi:hypothetical protein